MAKPVAKQMNLLDRIPSIESNGENEESLETKGTDEEGDGAA
ncbi:MAG TPA: hypothetical protein VNN73_04715 [Blastocatellia bacterium]|nr:hypothetical protein [Blastocatellia bacterium]